MSPFALLLSAVLCCNLSERAAAFCGGLRCASYKPTVFSTSRPSARVRPSTLRMSDSQTEPLLLRAARGEAVESPPVWMMRQAGRHMQVYRDLCKKHTTFRERSEIAEVATEISLQPFNAYGIDGVILFSDILTPLPGMGAEFDILEDRGPVVRPIRTEEDLRALHPIDPAEACPFVAEALRNLRNEVGNRATVLGFIGAPYTLATYLVEGATSRNYLKIKQMAFNQPQLLHGILDIMARNLADYACFQIEAGAQVIQMFDSWAGYLAPTEYDIFAHHYQKQVVQLVKERHPDVPFIMYIAQSGALLEKMASNGCDIVSVDWTVSMDEARRRIGEKNGVQGNLDPAVLFGNPEMIKTATHDVLAKAGPYKHIMNLGHGIEATTPEENAKLFVDTVHAYRY